jgi:hypothetical protein
MDPSSGKTAARYTEVNHRGSASCFRLDMPVTNSIPDIPELNSLRDSTPSRRCRSSVPTGSPALPARSVAELRCSDDSHTSPCQVVNRPESPFPADFGEPHHRNSQVAVAQDVPQDSVRIHRETAAHSRPGHATPACATVAFRPSADAARCAQPADCFPDHPASYSSPAAEDYWSVQLLRHSSPAAAHYSLTAERSPQAEPQFHAERARELDPTRFPAHAESSAMESVARSCRRTASARQQPSRHD